MEWICRVLKEASAKPRNTVRRWRHTDREVVHFCTRKTNEQGSYFSILTLNKESRSILIVPELALRKGWCDIASKIENFIKSPTRQGTEVPPRLTEANYPFAKAVQSSKCQTKSIWEAEIKSKGNTIEVGAITENSEVGSLSRCLVGWSEADIRDKPPLADIRKWSSAVWKNTIGT